MFKSPSDITFSNKNLVRTMEIASPVQGQSRNKTASAQKRNAGRAAGPLPVNVQTEVRRSATWGGPLVGPLADPGDLETSLLIGSWPRRRRYVFALWDHWRTQGCCDVGGDGSRLYLHRFTWQDAEEAMTSTRFSPLELTEGRDSCDVLPQSEFRYNPNFWLFAK